MALQTPQILLSLIEGFGLAFSPCILPILPFILASATSQSKLRPFLIIGGFIISFTIFSLISRQILVWSGIQQDTIQMGAYVLLLLFGLVMIIPFLEERFAGLTGSLAGNANNLSTGKFADSTLGGLMVGGLIGLVWTPCAGPILAAAILQVIQAQSSFDAFATIAAFAIGAGIPMLMIALFGQYFTQHFRALAKHATALRRAMGILIVAFSLLALSGINLAQYVVPMPKPNGPILGAELQNPVAAPYAAPAIDGVARWFNTEPLDLEKLKGKVVLIDFWTYSCINCIRTLPYIEKWYEDYKDEGLVVIGVHSPEFAFEGKLENVASAIDKFKLTYPVAMDNDFATWKNFQNKYWPAHYLIDRNGNVVYTHFGEGDYDVTENNIRFLLGLGKSVSDKETPLITAPDQTPETYLGFARANSEVKAGQDLPPDHWAINGQWQRKAQYLESSANGDSLTLRYTGKKVFLVMESADGMPRKATVLIDGKAANTNTADVHAGNVEVGASRLYEIVLNPDSTNGLVTIRANEAGLRLYVFTFES